MNRTFRRLGAILSAGATLAALAACGATPATNTPAVAPAATSAPAAAATSAPAAATTAPAAAATSAPAAAAATTAPAASSAVTKLNLNTLTEAQLMSTIPNFPTRMVREFQEYRPYISIQQFRKEIGKYVSADQVAGYEQYVYVPVDVNQADAATLQQLPGVSASNADALIAARPYASNAAFLTKLATLVSASDSAQAAGYLAN